MDLLPALPTYVPAEGATSTRVDHVNIVSFFGKLNPIHQQLLKRDLRRMLDLVVQVIAVGDS